MMSIFLIVALLLIFGFVHICCHLAFKTLGCITKLILIVIAIIIILML